MTYKTRFQYLFDKATDIAQARPASTSFGHSAAVRPLPPLVFVTDPARIHHPEDIAVHLPAGCGVVYRSFGEPHARDRARLLRRISRDHGLVLLIGEDDGLADAVEADGMHLAERSLARADSLRATHPDWLLTAACHSVEALKRTDMQTGLDAVFVSPVFVSHSASARGVTALGVKGARAMADVSSLPVYGLGGINCDTIEQLHDSGLAGVAAVDAFKLD